MIVTTTSENEITITSPFATELHELMKNIIIKNKNQWFSSPLPDNLIDKIITIASSFKNNELTPMTKYSIRAVGLSLYKNKISPNYTFEK